MLIFFKPVNEIKIQPIVVLDYTRNNEQFSRTDILKKVSSRSSEINKIPDVSNLETYSLNYRVAYSHNGMNPGNSLKTSCAIEIDNAPSKLVNLLNIKQYTKQESALAFDSAIKSIIDPQVQFPRCTMLIQLETNLFSEKEIARNFIIVNSSFSYDGRRISNALVLNGASYSSMVIQLNTAVNIKKDLPLVPQIMQALSTTGYTFKSDSEIQNTLAKVDRYYPPATLNNILSDIALDTGLFIDIDDDTKTVIIKSLNPDLKPKSIARKTFCFRGRVPGAKIISTISPRDYSSVVLDCEIEDIKIFDSIIIYDDSDSKDLFENYIEYAVPYFSKGVRIRAYQFYVLEYSYLDDRVYSRLRLTATNNWIVSNFRLGSFLEAAIYKGELGK